MPFRVDDSPISAIVEDVSVQHSESIYEGNKHRIFSLAFYMTDSELEAEGVMTQTFCLAFRAFKKPTAEQLDRALVSELRETRPIGKLTLKAECETAPAQVRHTTKRADFERAVVGLPSTERIIFLMHDVESYDHSRIARTLGITEEESVAGLFQARLKIRQLLF